MIVAFLLPSRNILFGKRPHAYGALFLSTMSARSKMGGRVDECSTDGFFNRVYDMVRQVPRGMVATYGQIAKLVGEPRRARYVGYALHVNPEPGDIPCHRIVFADGRLAEGFAFGGPEVQRALLEDEGVAFLANGHVDLQASRWPAGLV